MSGWSLRRGSKHQHGYAYAWHSGKFLVSMVDGATKALTMSELTAGCEVKSASYGPAYDLDDYLLDSKR